MTAVDRTKNQFVRLSYTDRGDVIITPEDEDRFVLTAQSAVKACQDHYQQSEAIKSFKNKFIAPLIDWVMKHSGKVMSCYIPLPIDCVQVFVVGASPQYDFELGKEIASLELRLFDSGWKVNVLQLPKTDEENLKTFFDLDGALEINAELEATPGEGDP